RLLDRRPVGDVTLGVLDGKIGDAPAVTGGAYEDPHGFAPRAQRRRRPAPEEAAGAGHERGHRRQLCQVGRGPGQNGRMSSVQELTEAVRGDTVPKAFVRTARRLRDRTALRWRMADGGWLEITWAAYADRAARMAGALGALG